MKTCNAIWYSRNGKRYHLLNDNLSYTMALKLVDELRKSGLRAYVVVSK